MAPARHRAAVDRLADLKAAGRADRPAGVMEAEAGGVPRQPEEFEHAAAGALRVGDMVLVADFQQLDVEQATPMVHGPPVDAVVSAEVRQIEALKIAAAEILEKT